MQGYTRNKKQVFSSDEYAKIVNKKIRDVWQKQKKTRKKLRLDQRNAAKVKQKKSPIFISCVNTVECDAK